jgi:tagatose 6-phosphate kinase
MIRVVGANPAMDRVSTWAPVRLGEVNRATSVSVMPGGKGFNVARAAVRLGSQAVAYGFLGGPVGAALRAIIIADGVVDRHTDIAAGTWVCFIVVEPGTTAWPGRDRRGDCPPARGTARGLPAGRSAPHLGQPA